VADERIQIRPVSADEVPLVLQFVRDLAEYEHEPESAKATEAQMHAALFGQPPAAEAVIAWYEGQPAGMALWFQTFSTWTGQPGLWLEDLFVRVEHRRRGIGRALLVYLARVCIERNYGRFEWSVLDWNEPSIAFYRALGAEPMSEWTTQRVTGDALKRLAAE
jgi:GNAT superfamily N-acetyltransferase